MYIGIIAPTLERKHSPTKQRFELYHHVNTLSVPVFRLQRQKWHVLEVLTCVEAILLASVWTAKCSQRVAN